MHYPNRGAFVATPSLSAGDDLFAYRTLLEQGGLALALERGADLGGLRDALAVLAAMPEDEPWGNVARAHYGIHGAIVDAAASERLSSAYAALRAELLFFVACIPPALLRARPDRGPRAAGRGHRTPRPGRGGTRSGGRPGRRARVPARRLAALAIRMPRDGQ